ncbi:MAG TPA: MBL fold metallo-hydrolase [Opitutaceae bacterium]
MVRLSIWAVGFVLLGGVIVRAAESDAALRPGATLPPWRSGYLDIHQIATGRGNAALIIGPDGTSVLIDAGAASGNLDVTTPPRPDGSRRPGEWIARYALRQLRPTGRAQLDYFVATHLHPDHIGGVETGSPPGSRDGSYVLSGVTDVAETIPIGVVIDRGFPDYAYPSRWTAQFAANYFAFIEARKKAGLVDERARVGATDQIKLLHAPGSFGEFEIRTIAANGAVWTGRGDESASSVPALNQLAPSDYPDENMCSIALRVSYGKFDYFTGGDLHCDTRFGLQPWRDVETPAARSAGPVEVAVANHHAYFDAVGADSVRALQPRVWVVPAWHITHLNIAVLERMLSERLYPGDRDIFVTDLLPATALLDERFIRQVKSLSGHIVVRVSPGGGEFRVFITGNTDESDSIQASYGPYLAK